MVTSCTGMERYLYCIRWPLRDGLDVVSAFFLLKLLVVHLFSRYSELNSHSPPTYIFVDSIDYLHHILSLCCQW